MGLRWRRAVLASALLMAAAEARAIPGYRISDPAAAQKAVEQYAADSSRFSAVVYQAELDKNVWQLALMAHRYLQLKPNDPQRKCSFAMAYWRAQEVTETVPLAARKQLQGLYEEAARDSKEAATDLPDSATAHLNYGQYLMSFVPGTQKVAPMLHEFQAAVSLKPDSGETHYWLAEGFASTGNYSAEMADRTISEAKKAIALDQRLSNSYYALATAYALPSKHDYGESRFYLSKYLTMHPEYRTRQDILAFQKYLKEKLPNG